MSHDEEETSAKLDEWVKSRRLLFTKHETRKMEEAELASQKSLPACCTWLSKEDR